MSNADILKVVIGAGDHDNNPGWLQTQQSELDLLKRSNWANTFAPNTLEAVLAEHVWEHLTYEEGIVAAQIIFDYLKPGGHIRCAVPDAFFPDESYQKVVQVGGPGPLDHPAASHKILHNYKTLSAMFEEAGFEVKLLEYCDENGVFHFHNWDKNDGFIYRSKRFDHRNNDDQLGFVSLIVDAIKPKRSQGGNHNDKQT